SATLKTAGTQSITASDGAVSASEGGIVVTPTAAVALRVTGFLTPTVAGVSHNFVVSARDAFGNVATDYTGTVSFSSSDSQATFAPPPYPSPAADAGRHPSSGTLKTAGTQSITASDGTFSASQTGIVVNAAAATNLIVSGYPSSTT